MNESFVFLAAGFEEIEALTVVDVLRRAGMPVKTVSITASLQVTGAHGITVTADLLFDNTHFSSPAWLIIPGGMPGARNLYDYVPLQGLLKRHSESAEGHIAAICAAPGVVLGKLGLLQGKRATCYPGFESEMAGAITVDSPVVVDGKTVTANGPANALPWALTIVREQLGVEAACAIATGMLLYANDVETVDNFFG